METYIFLTQPDKTSVYPYSIVLQMKTDSPIFIKITLQKEFFSLTLMMRNKLRIIRKIKFKILLSKITKKIQIQRSIFRPKLHLIKVQVGTLSTLRLWIPTISHICAKKIVICICICKNMAICTALFIQIRMHLGI